MKNVLYGLSLALLPILAAGPVNARQLDVDEALMRCGGDAISMRSRSGDGLKPVFTGKREHLNTLYVLNRDEGGYVVLAADDVAAPVLGYSETGIFDPEDVPDNMKSWLEYYSAEIAEAAAAGHGSYQSADAPDYAPVESLLKTQWGQAMPYNALCPEQNSVRTPAGCVATAIAQIMKYHSWPEKGTGEYSYQWNNNGKYETLSCDFSQITFGWDKMLDSYKDGSEIIGTQEQKDAVATLTYAAGIGSNMRYSVYGSAASAWNSARALIDNFGYDKRAIYLERRYYTLQDWTSMIYAELAAGRPVYYEGYNYAGGTGAGHAFVVDGYKPDGYFHLNWGWEGRSNGYFLLTALDPKDQGIGGSTAGYNGSQGALFGVGKPVADSEQRFVFYINGNLSTKQPTYVNSGNDSGGMVNFTVANGYLGMMSTPTAQYADGLPATPGVKVTPAAGNNGNVYYVWGTEARFTPKYKTGGTLSSFTVPASSFTGSGEFVITPVVKYGGHIEDVVVALGNSGRIRMTADTGTLTFVAERQAPELVVENLKVENEVMSGKTCKITATITNLGGEYYGYVYPYMYNSSGSVRMSDLAVSIPTGATVEVQWDEKFFTDPPPGEYQLTLADASGKIGSPVDVTVQGPTLVISSARFLNPVGTYDFVDNGTPQVATRVSSMVSLTLNLKCTKGSFKGVTIAPYVYGYDNVKGLPGISHGIIQSRPLSLGEGQSITLTFGRNLNQFDGPGGPLEIDHLYLVQTFVQNGEYMSDALKMADGTPGDYWILYGDKISGLELVQEDAGCGVYPNPAVSDITVTAPYPITEVSVYAVSGAKVSASRFGGNDVSEHIDVSALPAGHYLVLVRGSGRSGIVRLVKR